MFYPLNPLIIQPYPLIIHPPGPGALGPWGPGPPSGADDLDAAGTDAVAPAARAAECRGERGRRAGGALVAELVGV
jgi:hypothetical protein